MLRTLTVAVAAFFTSAALAQNEAAKPLGIGDAAPKIEVSKVVKGKLPASLDDGKVQVVESVAAPSFIASTAVSTVPKAVVMP